MSDEDFDEDSFRAYENDLYGETSSDSEEEIASEIEEALYSQVHYSFSLPNEEDLDEKDVGADSPDGTCNPLLLEAEEQDNKVQVEGDLNEDEDSTEKIDYIVIDEESCSSYNRSGNTSNQEDNSDDDDDADDNHSDEGTGSTQGLEENWTLIKEDLETGLPADGKRRPVSRYYKKEGNFRCHSCNEKGHKASDCPTPKKISCFLCGGEHTRRRCPNELCFNCHEPGHRVMNCRQPRRRHYDQCRRCYMLGHYSKDCPDHWRQYHRTTDPKKNPMVNRAGEFTGPVYCYNCSKEGHYGHECIEPRMDNYMTPTYPFVVKYDGDPEDQQDRHILQDKSRKRTKTHGGTFSQSREGTSVRSKKQQRRNKERHSWSNASHGHNDSQRIEEFEEGFSEETKVLDGRVGEFIERISERTKKRHREKTKRNSWSGQTSHDHEQSSRMQDIDQEITFTKQSPIPHDRKGSTHGNSNSSEVKIGSKRKHSGTPHHESKKGKQAENTINKQKKKKKKERDAQSTSHNQRIVELVHDDEVYHDYQINQREKAKNKKFNKGSERPLPDAFTRMVGDWEEMDASHHHHHRHSSQGYTQYKSHSSPAYHHRQSQGSSHRQYNKFENDKHSSREHNNKPYNSSRGFRSKWK